MGARCSSPPCPTACPTSMTWMAATWAASAYRTGRWPPTLSSACSSSAGRSATRPCPCAGPALADLDPDKVNRYLALVRSTFSGSAEEILRDRGCVVQQGGAWVPTNAGMLLFGRVPPRQAQILLVRYAGRTPSDQFLRKEVSAQPARRRAGGPDVAAGQHAQGQPAGRLRARGLHRVSRRGRARGD